MKKYFTIIILSLTMLSIYIVSRDTPRNKFIKDLSIHGLPRSMHIGAFEQRGNIQWSSTRGDPLEFLFWARENGWQARYSKGDNFGDLISETETNILKVINIEGEKIDLTNINYIFNKIIDRTDAGYLIITRLSSNECRAVFVVFRT